MNTINSPYENKDYLYQKYIIENKTMKEIAKEIDVSTNTIWRWVNSIKIDNKPLQDLKIQKQTEEKQRINDFLYNEHIINKKSVRIIAEESNVSSCTIIRWLREFNIPLRPYQEDCCLDLVGQKFGMLTVISSTYSEKNFYNKATRNWICKCDCGKGVRLGANQISTGWVSCGCARRKMGYCEISGSKFNQLRKNAIKRSLEFNITIEYIWDLFLKQNRKCVYSE